jgi:hypothetical protein
MKDQLLETLFALRILYFCMGNSAAHAQIERDIKQHTGEQA